LSQVHAPKTTGVWVSHKIGRPEKAGKPGKAKKRTFVQGQKRKEADRWRKSNGHLKEKREKTRRKKKKKLWGDQKSEKR